MTVTDNEQDTSITTDAAADANDPGASDNNTAQTLAASEEACAGQCSCTKPCRCLQPYELKVKVVTRLAGIPVEGVGLYFVPDERPGEPVAIPIIFKSDSNGEYTVLMGREKNLKMRFVYANETEKLKAEEVTVDLKNLLPSCRSKWLATADFHHIIKKIQDVLGDIPSELDIQNAEEEYQKAKKEWDKAATCSAPASVDKVKEMHDKLEAAKRNLAGQIIIAESVQGLPGLQAGTTAAVWPPIIKQTQKNVEEQEEALRKILAAGTNDSSLEELESIQTKVDAARNNLEQLQQQREAAINTAGGANNGGAANVDMDFEDEYQINAEIYNAPEESTPVTTPVPPATYENIHSYLKLEAPKDGNRMKVHLSVSLATFSLAMPYMSQLEGHVNLKKQVATQLVNAGVSLWEPASLTDNAATDAPAPTEERAATAAGEFIGEVSATYKTINNGKTPVNPWGGEYLCSPTSSTMVVQYYDLPGSIGNTQARCDIMAEYINNSADKKENIAVWEDWAGIGNSLVRLANKAHNSTGLANLESFLSEGLSSNAPDQVIPLMMPSLAYGHPMIISVLGGHIVSVRGVVMDHNGGNLWAICNDPYGSLAATISDYSRMSAIYSYYEGIPGQSSSSRRARNTASGGNFELGRHVYYNGNTHTRTARGGKGAHMLFRMYTGMTYRHPNDANMATKDFVRHKLIKGE